MTPPCSKKIKKQDGISGGSVPIFSSNTTNNGIVGYCNLEPHWKVSIDIPRYLVFGDHTRTFNIAECDFCVADNVKVLVPKIKMCTRDLLYIITVWKKAIPNLGYSRHWSVAKKVKLNLPVTSAGEIDFAFMQARIQEMEQARIQEMDSYLKVAGFENCELTDEEEDAICKLPSLRTKTFIIGNLFKLKKGKRLTKANMASGTINFIGSSASNNGITAQISNNQHIHDGNKITVTYNGSVGEAFYQTDSFWASDDVNVLTFKQNLNERLALFFCTVLRKRGQQYEYTYKWTKELMEKDSIVLPVTLSGKIDYHFMETYIRAQEKLAIQRVKDWREKEIAATKEVVN